MTSGHSENYTTLTDTTARAGHKSAMVTLSYYTCDVRQRGRVQALDKAYGGSGP